MKKYFINYLKEEAARAKKEGLTKKQFFISEILIILIEFLKASFIFLLIILSFVFFG